MDTSLLILLAAAGTFILGAILVVGGKSRQIDSFANILQLILFCAIAAGVVLYLSRIGYIDL
jgi:hypothetical protein